MYNLIFKHDILKIIKNHIFEYLQISLEFRDENLKITFNCPKNDWKKKSSHAVKQSDEVDRYPL